MWKNRTDRSHPHAQTRKPADRGRSHPNKEPVGASRLKEGPVSADVPTVTIWGDKEPEGASVNADPSSVELGTRFTASANGVAIGVRFCKTPENEGTHDGNLWDANGKRLATATFENETARGWQTVYFDAPVAIAADERYVASYLAPEGHYLQTHPFWSGSSSEILSVPRGSSGVYAYGESSSFPTKTWNRNRNRNRP